MTDILDQLTAQGREHLRQIHGAQPTDTELDPVPARDWFAFRAGLMCGLGRWPSVEETDALYHQHQQRFDRSRLYFEAHITIAPPEQCMLPLLETLARNHDWRVSTFAMLKPGEHQPDAFISARDESYARMASRVRDMVALLGVSQFSVKRWKIEDTMLDSNRGDTM